MKKEKLTATKVSERFDLDEQKHLYLERCLMEALRLDPPVPMTVIHTTTADCKIESGERIPKGTKFAIKSESIYQIVLSHLDPLQNGIHVHLVEVVEVSLVETTYVVEENLRHRERVKLGIQLPELVAHARELVLHREEAIPDH